MQHVECHIAPHLGSAELARLTGSQVNALYAKLAESGKKDGQSGLSALTVHHVHACLHKACKDAVRWGRLPKNPLDSADPPRKKGDGTKEMMELVAGSAREFSQFAEQRRSTTLRFSCIR